MVSHVLEPKQGAVGCGKQQALKGSCILGLQGRIHKLGLPLYQGLLCCLLLLLKIMTRLLLGLVDESSTSKTKVSGEFDELQ